VQNNSLVVDLACLAQLVPGTNPPMSPVRDAPTECEDVADTTTGAITPISLRAGYHKVGWLTMYTSPSRIDRWEALDHCGNRCGEGT
jgi:hypothetical protein